MGKKSNYLYLLRRLMHLYIGKRFTYLDSPSLNIHARLLPMGDFYQSQRIGYYKIQERNLEQIDLWTFPDSLLSNSLAVSFLCPLTCRESKRINRTDTTQEYTYDRDMKRERVILKIHSTQQFIYNLKYLKFIKFKITC